MNRVCGQLYESNECIIARAAERFSQHPLFVGYWLTRYRNREGLTEEELAFRLGCNMQQLNELRICKAPRPDRRARDILEIARVGGGACRHFVLDEAMPRDHADGCLTAASRCE